MRAGKNIGLITARGGSRGLPRKNVVVLKNKPLLAWTIEAALQSVELQQVFVSTEDEEIARISRGYGATVIRRPSELAGDETPSDAVVNHALEVLRCEDVDCNLVCLLQPTSPLRNASHIDEAFRVFSDSKADCVVSVYEPNISIAKSYIKQDDGSITPVVSDDAPYIRRQDLPSCYLPNGAIYVFSAERFMKYRRIPRTRVFPMVMSPRDSVDIDDEEDLRLAEARLGENE